ncbi:MAG: hypothetical protein WDO13_17585 [Verrucomicrobiota bacterium]
MILAEAQKDSEIKRGQAEADAAQIYSQAHRQDPDFYLFLRKLETLKKTINQNTTLVLDANQAPFDLLKGDKSSDSHDASNSSLFTAQATLETLRGSIRLLAIGMVAVSSSTSPRASPSSGRARKPSSCASARRCRRLIRRDCCWPSPRRSTR